MFKKAFTLAEILIVISIIGVVAALTIPNLSRSFDESEITTRVKIAYNDFELAYQKAMNKYGPYETWNSGLSEEEKAKRILDFLKGNYCAGTDCVPDGSTFTDDAYIKKEVENGSVMAVRAPDDDLNNFEFIVFPLGKEGGNVSGKDIFMFYTTDNNQTVVPKGYGSDRDSDDSLILSTNDTDSMLDATNWVLHIGNLDYLDEDCLKTLNWKTKTSCN